MHFVIVCPVGDEPANLWKFNYEDYGYIQFIAVSIETKTIKHDMKLGRSWLIFIWNPSGSCSKMEPKDELWRIGRILWGTRTLELSQDWGLLRKSGEIMVYHWIWEYLIFGQTQTFCPTGSGSVAGDQEWEGPMRACILWVADVMPIQRIQ